MKKKKNIAFVIPSLGVGGAERVVVSLSNSLIDKYNIYIYLLYNEKNIFYKIDDRIVIRYCNQSLKLSNGIISAFSNNFKIFKKLSDFVKKDRVNTIIGFTTTCNLMTILVASYNKCSSIISDRSNPYNTKLNFIWSTIRYVAYKKCDKLIVQTKLSKNFFKFVPNNKIVILPNPLSNELIVKRNPAKIRTNSILYVARLDRNKAQDILIKAFANLSHKDWDLILVGDGNKSNEYRELVESLNLSNRVIFTGKRDDPHSFYNTSKIFAFTSQSEGFPNSLIEAMYFGLPCISTDCKSGPSELIEDGVSGLLISVNDIDKLTEALETLIQDSSLCTMLSTNAREKAENYVLSNVLKQWENVIESV